MRSPCYPRCLTSLSRTGQSVFLYSPSFLTLILFLFVHLPRILQAGNILEIRVGQAGARRVATMTSPVLVDIREEVTCPICLELLTEPLSIDCGHSFCQACITPNSRESVIGQEGERSCPVCQTSYQPGNLRPNRHLANIVRRLREVVLGPGKQLKAVLCADHGEKLQLFCQEDGKVICWLCERSQEHRGHHTFLVEEVAREYQVRPQDGRGDRETGSLAGFNVLSCSDLISL